VPEDQWDNLGPDALSKLEVSLVTTDLGFRVLVSGHDAGEDLRSPETTRLAPRLATNPCVREKLSEILRSALAFGDLVADGRDMGTVVFPEADLKVFLTASLEERARRRLIEEGARAGAVSIRNEAARIRDRDETDSTRSVSPLRRPAGAMELDTTSLSFEEQVSRLVAVASALTSAAGKK
jgi:cytidylate kinase